MHTCDVCGKRGEWTGSWWWYGMLMDGQHEESILIMCSDKCKKQIKDPKKALADKIAGRPWILEKINWKRGLKLVRQRQTPSEPKIMRAKDGTKPE